MATQAATPKQTQPSSLAKWLSETTFCDCEEWCVHAEVQRLAAQQHSALWMLLRLDMVAIDKEEVGWQHVQQLQDVGNAALKAAEAFKEKYE